MAPKKSAKKSAKKSVKKSAKKSAKKTEVKTSELLKIILCKGCGTIKGRVGEPRNDPGCSNYMCIYH